MTMNTDANQAAATTVEALPDAQLDSLAAGSLSDLLSGAAEISKTIAEGVMAAAKPVVTPTPFIKP